MLFDPERKWTEQVNRIFSLKPRNGATAHSFWLDREPIERQFDDFLHQEGVHICVDGPSGTGKTSLVTTGLSKSKRKFFEFQWKKHTTWSSFCRKIIGDLTREESNFSVDVLAGFKGLRPEASLKLSFGKKKSGKQDTALWREIGDLIDEDDVARVIELSGRVLFIDDFEKAEQKLVVRIADLCKSLTQSYKGKVVIVGTNDIYRRLLAADIALDSRLKELSVGVLSSPDDAWRFLSLGFQRLGLVDPQSKYSHKKISYDDLRACKEQVYDAVDSLPKALTEFGRELCLEKRFREEITTEEMRRSAEVYFYKRVSELEQLFPEFAKLFTSTVEVRIVMEAIYSWPIGAIIKVDELHRIIPDKSRLTRDQVEHALASLAKKEIIALTGKSRGTIFVTNLPLAHTFGVCVQKRDKYQLAERTYGKIGQLSLPFYKMGRM